MTNMKSLALVLALVLLASVVTIAVPVSAACVSNDETRPCYDRGTHLMILKFKVEKSDCFKEIYARAAVIGHPEIVLNKQSYYNNDQPDAGPSDDKGTFRWPFSGIKITNADSEGFRAYMEIYTVNDDLMETKTKYERHFNIDQKEWDLSKTQGYFHLYAQPTLCLQK